MLQHLPKHSLTRILTNKELIKDIIPQLKDAYAKDPAYAKYIKDPTLANGPIYNRDNLLYYRYHNKDKYPFQLIVPEIALKGEGDEGKEVTLRESILRKVHEDILIHLAAETCYTYARKYFTWKNMEQDFKDFIKTCDFWQRNKPDNHKPYGLLNPLEIPDIPWTHIAMDFVGPLPLSNWYDGILDITDRFSGMVRLLPVNMTIVAPLLAKLMTTEIFKLHGIPISVVSDRDPRINSKFYKAVMHALQVHLRMSTAFHPQSDGSTERMNRLVNQMMRNLVNLRQDNWSDCLPAIEFAINSHQNSTTKKAPFELVYGRIPNAPLLNELPIISVPQADNFMQELAATWKETPAIATATRTQQAEYYNNKHAPPPKFEVGQKVLLSRKNINTKDTVQNKFSPLFIGPYKIIETYHNIDDYKLELPAHLKVYPVFHVSLLRPYHDNDNKRFPSRKHARPPPLPDFEDQESNEYVVSAIVDSRFNKRSKKHVYRVRWQGYPPSEDTWEPESSLTAPAVQDLIKEYHEHFAPSSSPPPSPKRRRTASSKKRRSIWFSFFSFHLIQEGRM